MAEILAKSRQMCAGAEFADGAKRAGADRVIRIVEQRLQSRPRVVPMNRRGGDGNAPQEWNIRSEPRPDTLHRSSRRKPTEGRDKGPRVLGRCGSGLYDRSHANRHPALRRQHARGKCFTGFRRGFQLLHDDFPARIAGDAQAIEIGFDAVVQSGQIAQQEMRPTNRRITQQPQESGLFRVSGNNIDRVHDNHPIAEVIVHRESTWVWW